MKRLFALMVVLAFTFSMVSFAQDAPKAAKATKAKVEMKKTDAKKETQVKTADAKKETKLKKADVKKETELQKADTKKEVKAAKATTEKVAKHKVKKAAKTPEKK